MGFYVKAYYCKKFGYNKCSKNKIWFTDIAKETGDRKICCDGTVVTMATNAYFRPAKCHTLCVIVTHLQRKTCCHTLKEKCHAISDKEYITLFTNIKNSEQTCIEKGQ